MTWEFFARQLMDSALRAVRKSESDLIAAKAKFKRDDEEMQRRHDEIYARWLLKAPPISGTIQ